MSYSKLLFALDPFGPLSPLNPRHPFNALRWFSAERQPPLGELDGDHRSLLLKLYGDDPPFPNMEWWWNTIDCETDQGSLSILTNVHLFGLPLSGPVVQSTLAVRDLTTEEGWQAHATGEPDASPHARFRAKDWRMHWDPQRSVYEIDVTRDDLTVELRIQQGPVTFFRDRDLARGWYDNNPEGLIPYWASYRSRFSSQVEGALRTPSRSYQVLRGHARFDHQSLHWSARDLRNRSPAVLAEALITRPQWRWYHARLEAGVNLMAYELSNGHTDRVIKRAAALCDDQGNVELADPRSIRFVARSNESIRGRVRAPKLMQISFAVPRSRLDASGGPTRQCSVVFSAKSDQRWTVRYPIAGPFGYEAEEVCGDISPPAGKPRSVYWRGEWLPATGRGTLEVLDMLKSVTVR